MVSHTPPADTALDRIRSGKHVGSAAVRQFIESHHPDLVICGHIHESRGIDSLGSTVMVNCGPACDGSYALIELGDQVEVKLAGL
jgi:hypothetical protein